MTQTTSLQQIFSPTSVAVVGASNQAGSVGGAVYRNLQAGGFAGRLFPVNRKRDLVGNEIAFGSVSELPEIPDLVVVCTPAPTVSTVVKECGQRGVGGVVVISAGFRETGIAGIVLEDELKACRREFPRLRMIGPNCLGILRSNSRLNASFSPVMSLPGRITFLSQSGALCTAILDWSIGQNIGFATCVSLGNMADVGMSDLIDHFANDDETDALLLYIEGLTDAERFVESARNCSKSKPLIAYKAGRFAESAHAAASHTGAIASSDAVYDAAFRRAGIERVNSIAELFDCARLLVSQNPPAGNRLAIVTNAGGPGVMASDCWLSLGGRLAELDSATVNAIGNAVPSCWSKGNPIDVLGDASSDRFQIAIAAAVEDRGVDALLVIVTPQSMTDAVGISNAIAAGRSKTQKPLVASLIGGEAVEAGRRLLRAAGIPVYDFPEEAISALSHLASAGRMNADVKLHGQQNESRRPPLLAAERRDFWRKELGARSGLVDEVRSKQLLSECGIPIVPTCVARTDEQAVSMANEIGYPVVLKILSPDISHKTDVGGVVLNIADEKGVRSQFARLMKSISERCPNARLDGVSVQAMVAESRGVELLLGMTRDAQFGPILLLGAGGVTAELQKDSVIEIAPFDGDTVQRMLRSLRLFPLLSGFRGRPGVDLQLLENVVARFAQLAEELPEVATIEINPLLVTRDKVIALDARVISKASISSDSEPGGIGEKTR